MGRKPPLRGFFLFIGHFGCHLCPHLPSVLCRNIEAELPVGIIYRKHFMARNSRSATAVRHTSDLSISIRDREKSLLGTPW